ncbi:hypothetical protein GCM10023347_35530 [Streptomyces chumphonensis]
MRTSMAMGVLLVGEVCGGARAYGGVASAVRARAGRASTHGAGEAAQVDVQARDEQAARGLGVHVVDNHGHIVAIPDPGIGRAFHDADVGVSEPFRTP